MVITLFLFLSFSSYIFAGDPTGGVTRQQGGSTLLNVRTALSNRLTPQQHNILIPCLTIATRTCSGLLLGYVVRRYKESLIIDGTNIQDTDCYVDLGDMCMDTCNHILGICYLP